MTSKAFLEMDETGVFVEGYGWSRRPPEGSILVPKGLRPEAFQGFYLFDGKLRERPKCPTPTELTPGVFQLKGCPVGSTVLIVDTIGREALASVEIPEGEVDFDFHLTDPGTYRVEVEPPLPYMPSKAILEVQDVKAIAQRSE